MNQDQGNRIRNMHPDSDSRDYSKAFTLFHTSWLRIFPGSTNIHFASIIHGFVLLSPFFETLVASGCNWGGGGKRRGRLERKTAICPLHFANAAGACKIREMIRKFRSSVSSRRFDPVSRETTRANKWNNPRGFELLTSL